MARILTLGDLQQHFEQAREKLSRDRQDIVSCAPLPDDFDRDKYGFSYFRAERIGLEAITASLQEVAWLPMQLDPQAEIVLENRTAMKRWLNSSAGQPDGTLFGNDFIHALTRTALIHGWNSVAFRGLALRVGELFHDLSCLIGLIYYGVWMSENGIEGLPVTNPHDLEQTAQEIEKMTRSHEISQLLKRRKKLEEQKKNETILVKDKKSKPFLRVIENEAWQQPPA